MVNFGANLDALIARVEAARLGVSGHHIVKIVGASKYSDASAIEALYRAGQRAFGENRVQDLLDKVHTLADLPIEWHFIGRLQTNKINHLIEAEPFLVHGIESLEHAQAIDKRLATKGKKWRALLQVNAANEESKAGVTVDATLETYAHIQATCPHLTLDGLMTIGAHSDDRAIVQQSFETTKKLFDALPKGASILSMGMSGDFELAIACGSTMVRVGSALFK
ncbi:MAG: hypothetical protein KU37_08390 [Sulfuricurvum sp. PC08-66]|nr:MAG: hypothetical protein KU37_08390 [Sulfuricurvum sp. PC08-66]